MKMGCAILHEISALPVNDSKIISHIRLSTVKSTSVAVKSDTIKVDRSMFLPNTDSFVLIRRTIVKASFPVFLPNTDSFLLIRRTVVKPSFPSEAGNVLASIPQSTDWEQPKIKDQSKRNFLKVASIAGAGIVASQLFSPKSAQAFIMGSSPTTGVVGVKNAANTRINPATEETVSSLLKPSDLTFDTGSLQVKVTSLPAAGSSSFSDSGNPNIDRKGLVDADRHV